MDPETLFIRTIDECRKVIANPDDYSILRTTAYLRQLLLDENRLVDVVNRTRREPLKFVINDIWETSYAKDVMGRNPFFYCPADGLYPGSALVRGKTAALSRDQFLKHRVLYSAGNLHTVRDVICHCANVLGGVHIDSPKTRKAQQLSALHQFQLGGLPLNLRQMLPILRVVLDALQPLYERIRSEQIL